MKPIRIAYCLDSFDSGGTELNAVRTAERLDRRRFEVHFACLSRRGPLVDRVEAAAIPITEFRLSSLASLSAVTSARKMVRWLRSAGIDVLHAHDIYSNIFAVPCARAAGIPAIASRRWWTETNRSEHVWLNRQAYRLARAVLANSDSVAQLVVDEGVPRERVFTIPNFVDEAAFEPPPRDFVSAARAELGIKPDDQVLGVIANLHPIKDHRTLLGALALVSGELPRLRTLLIGEGSERQSLGELASSLGIGDRVIMAGRRPHSPSFHWVFDASALTSRGEGFPNSVVEAMAARRPIVATRVGGVPDAIDHEVSGLLVPAGDAKELAGALLRLFREEGLASRLAAKAQQTCRERFAGSVVLPRLTHAYESLATPSAAV
ncbi:MAG: glycosyltransferase [Gemmatimonadota bacterium]